MNLRAHSLLLNVSNACVVQQMLEVQGDEVRNDCAVAATSHVTNYIIAMKADVPQYHEERQRDDAAV